MLASRGAQVEGFTSGRVLARNTVWNIIGRSVPLLAAIFAIPLLIEGLGTERFGVLTLAWMVVGYFSLFDLGLGRALTKLVADKLGAGQEGEIPPLVWTGLTLMAGLGIVAMLLLGGLTRWLVLDVLKIPVDLQSETINAFYLLALSIPLVISTAGLRGVLEAYQRFGLINAVRIPMGTFYVMGPLMVLPFTVNLFPIVAVLVAGRTISWIVYFGLCLRNVPWLGILVLHRTHMRPLLSFGGWITVSNVIGPLLLYLDRFFIGALISMTAVAYYTTPYEIVTKFLVIPSAVLGVMFPAFSVSFAQSKTRATYLYKQAMKYIFSVMFPIAIVVVVFAQDGLAIWLNEEFAANSYQVAQLLVTGVLISSMGLVSQALVQASGRPDLTAKLHMVELPMYLTYLWVLLHAYGIIGAAIAWVIRVTISALVLTFLAHRSVAQNTATSF